LAQPQKLPLRPLAMEERRRLEQMARSRSEPADRVTRARALLAVADGEPFTRAARRAGRRSGDAIARVVARFNEEGFAALDPLHGGGPRSRYGPQERERILQEFRRPPDRERDGTATWSLGTLQRALRAAPDGLPEVSTFTILAVLRDAGYAWQKDRTWCDTGTVLRKRKDGVVKVTDPEADAKRG